MELAPYGLREDELASARCRAEEVDPDWFFSRSGTPEYAAAKRACYECPVRAACLRAAGGTKFGIWGGLDGRERRRMAT